MLPLKNIRILDLSEGLVCSLATLYLSRFGAEVTKVENPDGDPVRRWGPWKGVESLYFQYLNGGKQSIVLNLETEAGREQFKRLLPRYDVLCVNDSEGRLEALGLGYEALKVVNPDLIYAVYSYFGSEGPMRNRPGSSLVVQALGVAMDMTGVVGGPPIQSAPSIAEHYAAGYLATGMLFALIHKAQQGGGQRIDISLQDSIFSCIEAAPAACSTVGEIHTRKGNFDPSCAPYDTFAVADGYVAVGVATQQQWEKFCDVLGFEDLKSDPRFLTNEDRRTDYLEVLRPVLEARMRGMGKLEVESKCREQGIPCGAVLTVAEITDMPNTAENGFLQTWEDPEAGTVRAPELPFALSEDSARPHEKAPALGEHTQAVLSAAGRV